MNLKLNNLKNQLNLDLYIAKLAASEGVINIFKLY